MNRNETIQAIGVHTLTVRLAWATLEVYADEVDDFQVLIAGDDDDVEDMRVKESEGTLTVEQPAYGLTHKINMVRWLQITVRVPRSWKGVIDLSTVAGPLKARGLSGTDLSFETVSGDLRVTGINGISTVLHTVTGNLGAAVLRTERVNLRTVSGDVAADGLRVRQFKLNGVNASMTLGFEESFERLEGNTVSGDIHITAPLDTACISFRAVTGKLRTNGVSIQDGAPEVSLTSVSGSLIVERRE